MNKVKKQSSYWYEDYIFQPIGVIFLLMLGSASIAMLHPEIQLSLDTVEMGFELFMNESYGYYTIWCALTALAIVLPVFFILKPESRCEKLFIAIKEQLLSFVFSIVWFLLFLWVLSLNDRFANFDFPEHLLIVCICALLVNGLLTYVNDKMSQRRKGLAMLAVLLIVGFIPRCFF
ncbi:hypothetical protein [Vibrio sp. OPT20]|uniref:hypothetical protein n=1 Tax=Vibrio sp. OPT20 TaxID=2778642 RepID=UPI00187E99C8|nr:hypothetical protein [Vibrio sp. OPT20]MBE8563790.1 hypothetical protein [Vibrio sp. OPT20]